MISKTNTWVDWSWSIAGAFIHLSQQFIWACQVWPLHPQPWTAPGSNPNWGLHQGPAWFTPRPPWENILDSAPSSVVFPLMDDDTDDNTKYPDGLGPSSVTIHVDHACIEPLAMLKCSNHNGYDVTLGNLVQVVHGRHNDMTDIVLHMDFCKVSMEIQCNDFLLR